MAPSKTPSFDPPMRPRHDIALCLATRGPRYRERITALERGPVANG